MDKEPRDTFNDYYQKFQDYQLVYAANDVVPLELIRDLQLAEVKRHKLEGVCQLEFDFVKPLCEMELNGIHMDIDKWHVILADIQKEKEELAVKIADMLAGTNDQTTLFGVSLINIDSNKQLLKSLKSYGLQLDNTDIKALTKLKGIPVIDSLIEYRKAQKVVSTYGEKLLAKIHKDTGRIHTSFNQMVSTGRMSSSNPNLQNIPNKQKFRTCFIAKKGCILITADMSGAELRILGNLSKDKLFKHCYDNGIDIHTKTASEVFKVDMELASTKKYRGPSKAVGFGICYGMSKFGLAERLQIPENEAAGIIKGYLAAYPEVARFLNSSGRSAVAKGYSRSISGRKRFYNIPPIHDPDRRGIVNGVEKQAKNAPIQGSNADTIKQSMVYCVERLEQLPYYAKLLLTVHDEIIIETIEEKKYEVAEIVRQSLIDGFGKYFTLIPMETDALIGPSWIKEACENYIDDKKCGGTEMIFIPNDKYGTKLVCKICGAENGGA
jgi:DNA polymerase-1